MRDLRAHFHYSSRLTLSVPPNTWLTGFFWEAFPQFISFSSGYLQITPSIPSCCCVGPNLQDANEESQGWCQGTADESSICVISMLTLSVVRHQLPLWGFSCQSSYTLRAQIGGGIHARSPDMHRVRWLMPVTLT